MSEPAAPPPAPDFAAPVRPAIIGIVTALRGDGIHRGQLLIRADGSVQALGDVSLLPPVLAALRGFQL